MNYEMYRLLKKKRKHSHKPRRQPRLARAKPKPGLDRSLLDRLDYGNHSIPSPRFGDWKSSSFSSKKGRTDQDGFNVPDVRPELALGSGSSSLRQEGSVGVGVFRDSRESAGCENRGEISKEGQLAESNAIKIGDKRACSKISQLRNRRKSSSFLAKMKENRIGQKIANAKARGANSGLISKSRDLDYIF